jgi:hypothetical protein
MQEDTLWLRILRTARGRYVRALEDDLAGERADAALLREEVVALRAENRALVNSLLGTAGLPPIETPGAAPQSPTGPATRRRSWAQIALTRELDATRKAAVREKHTISPAQ